MKYLVLVWTVLYNMVSEGLILFIAVGLTTGALAWLFGSEEPRTWALWVGGVAGFLAAFVVLVRVIMAMAGAVKKQRDQRMLAQIEGKADL